MGSCTRHAGLLVLCVVLFRFSLGFVILPSSPSFSLPSCSLLKTSDHSISTATGSGADPRTRQLSFVDLLRDHVRRNDTSPLTFTGYLTAIRKLSKNLLFLDFYNGDIGTRNDDDNDAESKVFQALLKREDFTGALYLVYLKCLHKGARLKVSGRADPTGNPGNVVLSIQRIELQMVPRQVQHIETILRQAIMAWGALYNSTSNDDATSDALYQFLNQVSTACQLNGVEDLQHKLNNATAAMASTSSSHRQKPLRDLAKTIFHGLQEDPRYPLSLVDDREIAKRVTAATATGPGNSSCTYVISKAPKQWRTPPAFLSKPLRVEFDDATCNDTVEDFLQNGSYLNENEDPKEWIAVQVLGRVQNRRRFEDGITVLSLEDTCGSASFKVCDAFSGDSVKTLESVLHPSILNSPKNAGIFRNLAAVGSKVSVRGILVNQSINDQGNRRPVLWIEEIRLVRISSQPSTIYQLLQFIESGEIGPEEAADALHLPHSEITHLTNHMSETNRKWKANQLAVSVQRQQQRLHTKLSKNQRKVIKKYQYLLDDFFVADSLSLPDNSQSIDNVTDDLADSSLQRTTSVSRWEIKKRPQIEWMRQQIQHILREHPDFGRRRLSILDIGGGKGMLAHYLGRTIENVQINVVDISAGAVANGKKKSDRARKWKNNLPLSMVNFHLADASSSGLEKFNADVVVALHACGQLTDIALAHAIHRRASFIIVPCCFKSNSHLTIPNAANMQGGLVHEWLGVPEEDLSHLKSVAEIQSDIATASLAMSILCGIRAQAVTTKMEATASDDPLQTRTRVELHSFPIEFSTRNMVLVGRLYRQ